MKNYLFTAAFVTAAFVGCSKGPDTNMGAPASSQSASDTNYATSSRSMNTSISTNSLIGGPSGSAGDATLSNTNSPSSSATTNQPSSSQPQSSQYNNSSSSSQGSAAPSDAATSSSQPSNSDANNSSQSQSPQQPQSNPAQTTPQP